MHKQAGWYPDPGDAHTTRYWDGARWTSELVWDGSAWVDQIEPRRDSPQRVTVAEVPREVQRNELPRSRTF